MAGGPRGNQPPPRLTGPRTAPTSGWPGASVELSSTWGSAPLLLLACSLRVLRRLLRLHPAPWQRERCPMATRRQPALQATNLRVKEVMAGGGGRGDDTQARLFPYSFNIYSNSARCPPVSAAAGPYVPQRAHPASEAPPAGRHTAPATGRVTAERGRRRQQMEEALPCHFLQFLICTVQLRSPSQARLDGGTHRPTATARLPRPSPQEAGLQRLCSSRESPVTVKWWGFFPILLRANGSGCNASPDRSSHAEGAMTGPGLISSGESPEWCHKQLM